MFGLGDKVKILGAEASKESQSFGSHGPTTVPLLTQDIRGKNSTSVPKYSRTYYVMNLMTKCSIRGSIHRREKPLGRLLCGAIYPGISTRFGCNGVKPMGLSSLTGRHYNSAALKPSKAGSRYRSFLEQIPLPVDRRLFATF